MTKRYTDHIYINYNNYQTLDSSLDTLLKRKNVNEHLGMIFVFFLLYCTKSKELYSGREFFKEETGSNLKEAGLSCGTECQYNSDKQDNQSRKETYSELPPKKTNADRLCDLQPAEFLQSIFQIKYLSLQILHHFSPKGSLGQTG